MSIFVARQRRDSKLITTCRTLLFQGSKLLHKRESGLGVSRQGVHRGRGASTRYLMNVGERRRYCTSLWGGGFLLLAPFPIYASRVVTRPARAFPVRSLVDRESTRATERAGKMTLREEATRDEAFKMAEATSSRCFRTVCTRSADSMRTLSRVVNFSRAEEWLSSEWSYKVIYVDIFILFFFTNVQTMAIVILISSDFNSSLLFFILSILCNL